MRGFQILKSSFKISWGHLKVINRLFNSTKLLKFQYDLLETVLWTSWTAIVKAPGTSSDSIASSSSSSESSCSLPLFTREYAKRNERVIEDNGKYADYHSFHPALRELNYALRMFFTSLVNYSPTVLQ